MVQWRVVTVMTLVRILAALNFFFFYLFSYSYKFVIRVLGLGIKLQESRPTIPAKGSEGGQSLSSLVHSLA